MKARIVSSLIFSCVCLLCAGGTMNVAPLARATASSELEGFGACGVNDGLARIEGRGEWRSQAMETFWGEIDFPWVRLDWERPVEVDRVLLYDRSGEGHTAAVALRLADGTRVDVGEIPADGSPREVCLGGVTTDFLTVEITDGTGHNPGLSEIEVFPTPTWEGTCAGMVNPFVETARGRYFFFITGCQPQGMIGAAPLTRNKNQGGGGYNYNDSHILGFPQIHAWMLSGLTFMPVGAGTDVTQGEEGWKSAFSHRGEIARPGYHRVYLEDHGVWVEQTASQRTSCYRLTYSRDGEAALVLNLGGFTGTSTMVDADARLVGDRRVEGSFATVGRLWGGPDTVRVYFVAEFSAAPRRMDSWTAEGVQTGSGRVRSTAPSVARNEGMSYHDAPSAGLCARMDVRGGEPVEVKMAISYVSVANAAANLEAEAGGRGFEALHAEADAEWNAWLGRIRVEGGTERQRVKFYTDLWHTLLGRHKIDDINGQYPDRTRGGRIEGKNVVNPRFEVRQLPMLADGKPLHHMYNTDALWLTQWNQNGLWGMAWPGLLDSFSASMVQYAVNGGLLPRGPCGGGYSFIMSGSPATSMITSAFQRGLCHKWNPRKAYPLLKRNHEKGGMLGFNYETEFDVYEREGFAPCRGGVTVQWTFEDWALSRMAEKLGKNADARRFAARSRGWRRCIHPELKLLLPLNADGTWTHTDPLSGWGFEEANSWQTTFGLSHDIPGLCDAMGGADTLCSKLDFAMRKSVDGDFVAGYGSGYVSYANQPGLSTAHVFAHAGKPWLSQYWVRRVKEQAYGAVSPWRGYGGHDEDQGQMGGVSALMAIGLFSLDGGSDIDPYYDITSPVFDRVTIALDPEYYPGGEFSIVTHGNSADNCYIQRATLNGRPYNSWRLSHKDFAAGGVLELWLGPEPNEEWGNAAM